LAQSITPRVPPGQLCQNRGDQPLRWVGHWHRIQALEQALQFLELSAGVGVARQQALEFSRLVRRSGTVENLMHAL
jgi:hypothetical protein